ncbi:uncharacterized protein [Heliangelus exortis]|uniref:uncharacterized protein n=1 Tax=Heliangelus exortis TaxID=472823 RepID=UPI003A8CFEC4
MRNFEMFSERKDGRGMSGYATFKFIPLRFLLGQCSAPLGVHRQGFPRDGTGRDGTGRDGTGRAVSAPLSGPELAVGSGSCTVPGSCSSARLSPLSFFQLLGCQDLEKTLSDLHLLHLHMHSYSHTMQLLALRGMAALSGDPQMAAEMQREAPAELVTLLMMPHADSGVKVEALLLFRALLGGQLEQKEASHMAVLAAGSLPALFDDESSQVRELSIILFRELLVVMVRKDKKKVEEMVRRTLISLFLRMSDESVAEASGRALLASAKFLGWRKLKRVVKNQETWRIGETLLEQERSWVEQYVRFSKIRLRAAPTGVRLAAIRFIGAAARRLRRHRYEVLGMFFALQCLENDPEPSVQSLGVQTSLILETLQQRQRSGQSLRALCCCL